MNPRPPPPGALLVRKGRRVEPEGAAPEKGTDAPLGIEPCWAPCPVPAGREPSFQPGEQSVALLGEMKVLGTLQDQARHRGEPLQGSLVHTWCVWVTENWSFGPNAL